MHKIKVVSLITILLLIVGQVNAGCPCTATEEETEEYLENRTDY